MTESRSLCASLWKLVCAQFSLRYSGTKECQSQGEKMFLAGFDLVDFFVNPS